jgi:hypothetical protein
MRNSKINQIAALLLAICITPASGEAAKTTAGNPAPPCTANTASCLQRVASLYLEALLAHDGSKLPLAANVRRSENALTNARGPFEVRESFARTTMIEAIRDPRYYIDVAEGEVIVYFRIDVDLKAADANGQTKAGDTEYKVAVTVPAGTYTIHEAERFKILRGVIREIEIIAHVETGKGGGSGWPLPRDPVVAPKAGKP